MHSPTWFLSHSSRTRYVTGALAYFAQGIPMGLLHIALPAWLSTQGVPTIQIATFLSVIMLPWAFKLLVGPLMDHFEYLPMGKRRPWVLGAQIGMVISLLSLAYLDEVKALADKHALKIHVDGARIFNAAVALEVDPAALVQHADSVSFCLSKGLGAPVGSLVCGSRAFIARARRNRKIVGGGMRQAGILAAAGLVAIEKNVNTLAADHANARTLAEGLAVLPGIVLDPGKVFTNIVFIRVDHPKFSAEILAAALEKEGVQTLALGPDLLRAVTHYHITAQDIDRALEVFRKTLQAA